MQIGLISDTHSYLDDGILHHLGDCDEVWHAGDIGSHAVADALEENWLLRAVYGNIDDGEMRHRFPLDLRFHCEGLHVWITHIGGYPVRYQKRIRETMKFDPPKLFICGHSHILKVMYDKHFDCLHMNPGACGHHGFHKIRTMLKFKIEEGVPKSLRVIELGLRGRSS